MRATVAMFMFACVCVHACVCVYVCCTFVGLACLTSCGLNCSHCYYHFPLEVSQHGCDLYNYNFVSRVSSSAVMLEVRTLCFIMMMMKLLLYF